MVSDAINANNSVTLNGTAEANSLVNAYEGSTLLSTFAADGNGAWARANGWKKHTNEVAPKDKSRRVITFWNPY